VTTPPGWDPVARDGWGAALSAAERCHREDCRHEWLGHDHAYAPVGSPEFGWCLVHTADGRCGCRGFVEPPQGVAPVYAPPMLTDDAVTPEAPPPIPPPVPPPPARPPPYPRTPSHARDPDPPTAPLARPG
jgi:hypothetical protein